MLLPHRPAAAQRQGQGQSAGWDLVYSQNRSDAFTGSGSASGSPDAWGGLNDQYTGLADDGFKDPVANEVSQGTHLVRPLPVSGGVLVDRLGRTDGHRFFCPRRRGFSWGDTRSAEGPDFQSGGRGPADPSGLVR